MLLFIIVSHIHPCLCNLNLLLGLTLLNDSNYYLLKFYLIENLVYYSKLNNCYLIVGMKKNSFIIN